MSVELFQKDLFRMLNNIRYKIVAMIQETYLLTIIRLSNFTK